MTSQLKYKIQQDKLIKWRPSTYTILSFFKSCLEGRDDEYIAFCNFIIFGRIMIGFEPLKNIDFNPHLSPTPLPFHCDTLFEWNSSPPLWLDTGAVIGSCQIAFSIAFCCCCCCCCCCCFFLKLLIMLNYQPIKELQLSDEQEKEDNLLHFFFFF